MSPDLGKPPGLLLMKYAGRGEFIGDVRGCEPVMVPSKFPAPSEERISFPRLESLNQVRVAAQESQQIPAINLKLNFWWFSTESKMEAMSSQAWIRAAKGRGNRRFPRGTTLLSSPTGCSVSVGCGAFL